jgi:hypothetical protein
MRRRCMTYRYRAAVGGWVGDVARAFRHPLAEAIRHQPVSTASISAMVAGFTSSCQRFL